MPGPSSTPPVTPRPRRSSRAAAAAPPNGHDAPTAFARAPLDPTDADLADWQRGAAALARMPARRKLELTAGIGELRTTALAELARAEQHVDRLRFDTPAMLESGIGERLGVRFLPEISTEPPPPMLLGRVDPLGHTMVYGTGGVGKGTLVSSWVLGLLHERKRILVIDYENHPEEWAPRIASLGAGDLMSSVMHVAPLTASWGGKRGPLWAAIEDLRALVVEGEIDIAVIDSAVMACAGVDPLDAEAPALYAGALEYLGVPVISLAHVTKDHDLRYPFGSVFWHNLARVTWSLHASGGVTLLTHRKRNRYAKVPTMQVEVTFGADGLPVDVWERSRDEALTRQISRLLGAQELTVTQLVEALEDELGDEDEVKADSVRKALRRGLRANPPRFDVIGSGVSAKWRNVA